MTERQLAERARHGPVEIVEVKRERKRNRSFRKQELIELQQGAYAGWAYAEHERLVSSWGDCD